MNNLSVILLFLFICLIILSTLQSEDSDVVLERMIEHSQQ